MTKHASPYVLALLAAGAWAVPVSAQVKGQPVSQGSGPLRELSTNVGARSGPVTESVGLAAGSAGQLSGNPVRGSITGDLVSGPVSDVSVGPVTSSLTLSGTSDSVGQASAGAVKKDIDSPLGARISEPLRELGPLQEQLRAIQPAPRNPVQPAEQPAAEVTVAQAGAEEAGAEPPDVPQAEQPEVAGEVGGMDGEAPNAPDAQDLGAAPEPDLPQAPGAVAPDVDVQGSPQEPAAEPGNDLGGGDQPGMDDQGAVEQPDPEAAPQAPEGEEQ